MGCKRFAVGNDIRLGFDTAKVVPGIVAKEECGLKVVQCLSDWADGASFPEQGFTLSVVALKKEDGMWVG